MTPLEKSLNNSEKAWRAENAKEKERKEGERKSGSGALKNKASEEEEEDEKEECGGSMENEEWSEKFTS